jgi:hypothetical protein
VAPVHRRADPADGFRHHSNEGRPGHVSGRGAVPYQHRCHDRGHETAGGGPPGGAHQRRTDPHRTGARRADLKDGRRTSHPELVLFASWGELQEYAEYDPAGRDLQPFVELVDTHGSEAIIAAVDALTDEDKAEVTVSTAHKAKGREWLEVRIADDFRPLPDSDRADDSGRSIPEPVSETGRPSRLRRRHSRPAPTGPRRARMDREPTGSSRWRLKSDAHG